MLRRVRRCSSSSLALVCLAICWGWSHAPCSPTWRIAPPALSSTTISVCAKTGRCSHPHRPKGSRETISPSTAITLFYYDQRIRREGYDIERMMDDAGLIPLAPPPTGESPIASVPPTPEEGQL